MRIVLATPLYPPEIAGTALYVKELARRIAKSHTVTIVAYARLPEKVPGVSIVAIDKREPLPLRLFAYFFALRKAAHDADILYVENGASTELPAVLVSLLVQKPLIVHIGDQAAHQRARTSLVLRSIERLVFARARRIITDTPLSRPEIFPLEPFPTETFVAFEQSWDTHLQGLEEMFTYEH